MRSRSRWLAVAAALLFATLPCGAQESPTGVFTRPEVEKALGEVKKDPNLVSERKVRTLKWVKTEQEKNRKRDLSWLAWIGELFAWVAQGGRFLFWGVLAVLAALLLIYLYRLSRNWRSTEGSARVVAPSFVRDLDIRPESLPADIGAAARQLWDRGERRAALALLYRGLLSRLAHTYRVPIRDSSTEGDCLAIAARTLDARRIGYATRLVRVWQRAIYGGLDIDSAEVHELCAEFDAHLERPSPVESPRREAYGAAT